MSSSPQIPLLETSVLASPRPSPDLFPFFLSPLPPFGLSNIAFRSGPVYDVNGIVLARVGCGVAVVSVHWGLHAIATGQDHRACTSEALPDCGFLFDAIYDEELQVRCHLSLCTCLQRAPAVHIGRPEPSLPTTQSTVPSFRRGLGRWCSPAKFSMSHLIHSLDYLPQLGHHWEGIDESLASRAGRTTTYWSTNLPITLRQSPG